MTKNLGNLGERLAQKYLKNKKYRFIDRNFFCNFGEIDLIFQDKDTLVFVEVKTRSSNRYGDPSEAVNKFKLESIKKTGQYFLKLNPKLPRKIRIDVVAIYADQMENAEIKHIKNVTS